MKNHYEFAVERDEETGTFIASWGDDTCLIVTGGENDEALRGNIADAILCRLGITFDYELPRE